jgi:hypothetical protein
MLVFLAQCFPGEEQHTEQGRRACTDYRHAFVWVCVLPCWHVNADGGSYWRLAVAATYCCCCCCNLIAMATSLLLLRHTCCYNFTAAARSSSR